MARPNYLVPVLLLAGVQLSHILDFVILMPLGPLLTRELNISTQSFSWLVSVYTLSAAISCLLAAFVMDRFDRKKVLVLIYSGLVLGTFMCAVSAKFELLLAARVITGFFGGLLQSIILAIVGDIVPPDHRGRATGLIMAAFAVSSVVGVPLGLAIANYAGWQSTFVAIAIFSLLNLGLVAWRIPKLDGHIGLGEGNSIGSEFTSLMKSRTTWVAWMLIVSMMSVFGMFPFISQFIVQILRIDEARLPQIYLVQGLATMVAAPLMGRLSDRFGAKTVFVSCSLMSMVLVSWFTHLEAATLLTVICLNTLMAAVGIGRMTPSMDLISRSVTARRRGSFMTLVAAVQQLAASGAAYAGGMILSGPKGMADFPVVGWLVAATMAISVGVSSKINTVE